jgi:hypothetical protein
MLRHAAGARMDRESGRDTVMHATAEPLIKLENVTKAFQTDEVETHALSGIHLEINRGDYVAISGPSGCGKSTLLSILGLLDTPTEGSYTLNGQAVAELNLAERARIRNREVGFIFQSFNLIGAADLPGHARRRAQDARQLSAGSSGHGASSAPPAEPALGRAAAARGGRQGPGRRTGDPARG